MTPTEREAKQFCMSVQRAVGLDKNPAFAIGYQDGLASEDAARNLVARKPAFGWLCSFSNAPACTFSATVNAMGGIEAAQDDLRAYFARHGRDVTNECWLDELLPLNRAAVVDLMRAYQRVGTFRDFDELEKRTAKYLPARADEPAPVADMRAPIMQAAE